MSGPREKGKLPHHVSLLLFFKNEPVMQYTIVMIAQRNYSAEKVYHVHTQLLKSIPPLTQQV